MSEEKMREEFNKNGWGRYENVSNPPLRQVGYVAGWFNSAAQSSATIAQQAQMIEDLETARKCNHDVIEQQAARIDELTVKVEQMKQRLAKFEESAKSPVAWVHSENGDLYNVALHDHGGYPLMPIPDYVTEKKE